MATIVDAIIEYGLSPATRRDRLAVSAFVRELALGQAVDGYAAASEALAGAEAVPDDREETAQATAEAGEPDDGQPPEHVGEQAVSGLELNGGESRPMKHVESLRHSGEWCNGDVGQTFLSAKR